MATLIVGGVTLPEPTKLSVNNEIIWSSNTGRSDNGTMLGDIVAEKKNIEIEWGILQESDAKKIKDSLKAGFFELTFRDDGVTATLNAYRGTISKEQIGKLSDGIFWYRSVKVSIIQQ